MSILTDLETEISKALFTEKQLLFVKETFLTLLKKHLHLHEVFAPLFLKESTGLNDDLNGVERKLQFQLKHQKDTYAIVQSLAKWKRKKLADLAIQPYDGIVTRMMAVRMDEDLSPIHSAMVDQWDWEMHITKKDRTIDFLKHTVRKIYTQMRLTEMLVCQEFEHAIPVLPEEIYFIHSEQLQALFPDKSPKEREDLITQKYGAVFIIGIGGKLADGIEHDLRAPDYDDWTTETSSGFKGLNGDILVWHPEMKRSLEISSMGIRVDQWALKKQLAIRNVEERLAFPFHQAILKGEIPLSIGGGIGQSRMAMFMLRKLHIQEFQKGLID
jgi:aspartate--ammonia ligase